MVKAFFCSNGGDDDVDDDDDVDVYSLFTVFLAFMMHCFTFSQMKNK